MADFARAGQKGQQAALFGLHQVRDYIGHVPPQQRASPGGCRTAHKLPRPQRWRHVPHLHRVGFTFAEHGWAAAQKFGHRCFIQRG